MTVQDENVHMGPRTAGNKSLMTFRTGVGVSGYVGYIPSCDAIPIPIKVGETIAHSNDAFSVSCRPRWLSLSNASLSFVHPKLSSACQENIKSSHRLAKSLGHTKLKYFRGARRPAQMSRVPGA